MAAKLQHWKQNKGINGLESIVRHHLRYARNTSDQPHVSEWYDRCHFNKHHVENEGFPYLGGEVPESEQVFDELHAVQDYYDSQPIELWLGACDVDNCLPDNLFGVVEELRKEAEEAANALVEYQDSEEPGMNPQIPVPDWARPQLLHQSTEENNVLDMGSPAAVDLAPQFDGEEELEQLHTAPTKEHEHSDTATSVSPVAISPTKEDIRKAAIAAENSCPFLTYLPDSGVGFSPEDVEKALIDGSDNMPAGPWSFRTPSPGQQLTFAEQASGSSDSNSSTAASEVIDVE